MGVLLALVILGALVYLLGAPQEVALLAVLGAAVLLIVRGFASHGVSGGIGRAGRSSAGWASRALAAPWHVTKWLTAGTLALMDEETKRWTRLIVGGGILWVINWVAIHAFGWAPRLLVLLLLVDVLWARAFLRGLKATSHNHPNRALQRKEAREYQKRLDQIPGQIRDTLTRAGSGAGELHLLRRKAGENPGNKDLQRILKEAEAEYDWYQPGASFEPVVPHRGATRRLRGFGEGFRKGWRRET